MRIADCSRRQGEREYLKAGVGAQGARDYWKFFGELRGELGYADYLGALQRYRAAFPHGLRLLSVSRFAAARLR